jgi:hypothetical protein
MPKAKVHQANGVGTKYLKSSEQKFVQARITVLLSTDLRVFKT